MTDPDAATARRAHHRRRLLTPVLAAAGLVAAGVFVAAGMAARANGPSGLSATSAPEDYGPAPTYRLVNQNGRMVSSREFAGKVQVVSFLFPYCTTYCPLIARTLAEVANTVATGPLRDKVQLVTFNVDPAGAGPAVLRRYIAQYGAQPTSPVWQYLTGTPAQIRRTVTGGYHVFFNKISLRYERQQLARQQRAAARQAITRHNPQPYTPPPHEPNPLAAHAHVNYDVTHNDYIEIVNQHGTILTVFDQASLLTVNQLLAAVTDVLTGHPIPLQQVHTGHPTITGP